MASILSASWLLSACQPGAVPDAVQSPPAILDPTTTTPGLLKTDSLTTPAAVTPMPTATAIPTRTPTISASLAAEPSETIRDQQETNPDLEFILPDSEVVYSPTALDFDTYRYLAGTSGYLGDYREYLRSTGWNSAADIIQRVALESSINPRLLLALIEYQTGCILSLPATDFQVDYLLGVQDYHRKGLYGQLSWAASQLSAGYYGWREGAFDEIQLSDGIIVRPAPELNAGSVALQYYFAQFMDHVGWQQATDRELVDLYSEMFGDPWQRSQELEPMLPHGLSQPELILPFEANSLWSFTSGPHTVWDLAGAQAALDFAPAAEISGCVDTAAWVLAVADGLVLRSEFGAVVQDLSGDGIEQTGWAILYMHIQSDGRVEPGTYLRAGDPIGHPSCEGGRANGTHLHIARKYNGEWIAAGGSLPFVLSGWTAHNGLQPYEGSLTRGKRTVQANPYGIAISHITRTDADP
jgi:LasA protease